mmetsp:Transcript_2669/g.7351  ORF Transcript_2669/g.7351 Transcript_2669/m.7351 type:complete len:104 (+) Transcript_2669:439-750(+)
MSWRKNVDGPSTDPIISLAYYAISYPAGYAPNDQSKHRTNDLDDSSHHRCTTIDTSSSRTIDRTVLVLVLQVPTRAIVCDPVESAVPLESLDDALGMLLPSRS